MMGVLVGFVNKAFGSLTYDMKMSEYKEEYQKVSFEESIAIAYGKQDKV